LASRLEHEHLRVPAKECNLSVRIIYSIVKGVDAASTRPALTEAASALPGPAPDNSRWSDHAYVHGEREMVGVVHGDTLCISDNAHQLAGEIARRTGALHMELRIQEGDHWDFSLYQANQLIADFSTRVGAWEPDSTAPRPWKRGSLETFARAWGVEPNAVEPYLIDWDALREPIYVEQGNEFRTHDWRQVLDFMRVIGVAAPDSHPERFLFSVPAWVGVRRRQPLWRRVVRRVSVWYKGSYPDRPRQTKQDRERWRRLRASVRIVRVDPKDLFDR
jgi:hypothetical protein